jgi:hypothetical protein
LFVCNKLHIALHDFLNQVEGVGHGDFSVGGDVDLLPYRFVTLGEGKEPAGGVFYVVEVAGCFLFVVCCLLFPSTALRASVVCCLLFVVCCSLFVVEGET